MNPNALAFNLKFMPSFKFPTLIIVSFLFLCACKTHAQEITLAKNSVTEYKIILPPNPSPVELKSANVLKKYFQQITGIDLKIVNEGKGALEPAFYLGHTKMGDKIHHSKLMPEAYFLQSAGKNIVILGGSGKGIIYGVYSFLENYLGCKKIADIPAIIPNKKTIIISGGIHEDQQAQFEFREVYYPACHDAEYLEWNKLHSFEDLWGLWGHSYNKLVPAKTFFKSHPEYYALVKGNRQPTQLCLSNEDVFKIVITDLKTRIVANPDAIYWSVSPNDDNGYCECEKCKATDEKEGGPSGSLIRFVNRVAKEFPEKKITTLAYGFTHRAPKITKPADNVYIFLSNIDAYRDKPLSIEGSATIFRNDLKAWSALTPNIFIWDYVTEFTNYLAPFPNFQTLQLNMQYLKDNGAKGIFVQGSGDTRSEWSELRAYLIAKLLWDNKADISKLTRQFLEDYYGVEAAKYLLEYLDLINQKRQESKRKLDIYGNPINEYNTYLSPELIDQYSALFDKADAATDSKATYVERVMTARLALDYTVFQQARFYGIERHGIFEKDENGTWNVKPKLKERLEKFVANCKKIGVTELSEGGHNPDQYLQEWNEIFKTGVIPTKAIGTKVTLQYPFTNDYPAKGNTTLIDGNSGYKDFSYNWLCFYGVPMVATIDLGSLQKVKEIKMHFLDDPRHWIFLPEKITIEVSKDGTNFKSIKELKSSSIDEHYECAVKEFSGAISKPEQVRFIKVTATNLQSLPEWRLRENKKPMIACDEIYVQ